MQEEDFGVLWRHRDWRTGDTEIRRSRRLVVSFFATVGNYDYGFFWYFYQDGRLQFEVKLTGILNTAAVEPGENGSLFADPGSSVAGRAGFATHHLWVTPYDPDEKFPAGDYPNQHAG